MDIPAEVIAEANQVEAKADSKLALASALHDVWIRLKGLPRWAYVAALTAMLLFAFVGVYLSLGAGSAKLRIVCQHSFRAADLSVVVDGKIVYAGSLNGNAKKRFGLFDKSASGSFSKTVHVPAGKHALQIHISAPAEGFDQAKVAFAAFTDERENVLVINSGRRSGLGITFQGGATAQPPSISTDSAPYPKSAFSILLSILGTMISASISFLVQEFWRSHKQRVASGSN